MPELHLQPLSTGRAADQAGGSILITRFPFLLGRSRKCDHVLRHPMISRQHCRFFAEGETVIVQDLGARNGTSVNARPVRRAKRVQDGDILKIGPLFFQARLGAPALAQPAAAAAESETTGRVRHVLVVEDNEDTAQTLAMLLHDWGHEVRIAHDGREALREAHEHPPDAVLLDIRLPGMDGYEVAERLRGQETLKTSRLVALTGYESEVDRRRSREAGFGLFLTKPVDVDTLHHALSHPG